MLNSLISLSFRVRTITLLICFLHPFTYLPLSYAHTHSFLFLIDSVNKIQTYNNGVLINAAHFFGALVCLHSDWLSFSTKHLVNGWCWCRCRCRDSVFFFMCVVYVVCVCFSLLQSVCTLCFASSFFNKKKFPSSETMLYFAPFLAAPLLCNCVYFFLSDMNATHLPHWFLTIFSTCTFVEPCVTVSKVQLKHARLCTIHTYICFYAMII